MEPFCGHAVAELPHAALVLEAFHVVKLGFAISGGIRRRVQQHTRGRRGHNGDTPYGARRILRRRADRLTDRATARLQAALAAGDRTGTSPPP